MEYEANHSVTSCGSASFAARHMLCGADMVLKENKRAIRFYEKCGFRFDGREEEITLEIPIVEVRMIKD